MNRNTKKRFQSVFFIAVVCCFVFTACINNGIESENYGEERTINIAYLRATFPVLSFALSVFDMNQNPTYLNIDRDGTFDYTKLPSNVEIIPGTGTTGNGTLQFGDSEVVATADFIRGLYEENRNTKFNLYICDFDLAFIVYFMMQNEIPESNYTVTTFVDGEGSYSVPFERYSGAGALEKFERDCTAIENALEKARNGNSTWADGLDEWYEQKGVEFAYYSLAVANVLDNVTLVYTDIADLVNGIGIKDAVASMIVENKIVERSFAKMVDILKAKGKIKELEYLLKLRWGESDNESVGASFDINNGKKTLIILGTTDLSTDPVSEVNLVDGYKLYGADSFLSHVIAELGGEYNIFYKGHPRYPTVAGSGKAMYFEANGITNLLGSIPAETMMYLYEDVYIGGYPGTTFAFAQLDQCIVSFGTPKRFDGLVLSGDPENFVNTRYMYNTGSGYTFAKR